MCNMFSKFFNVVALYAIAGLAYSRSGHAHRCNCKVDVGHVILEHDRESRDTNLVPDQITTTIAGEYVTVKTDVRLTDRTMRMIQKKYRTCQDKEESGAHWGSPVCVTVPKNGYKYKGELLDGKKLCCPAGWRKSGDGSRCDKPRNWYQYTCPKIRFSPSDLPKYESKSDSMKVLKGSYCYTYGNDINRANPHPCPSTVDATKKKEFVLGKPSKPVLKRI